MRFFKVFNKVSNAKTQPQKGISNIYILTCMSVTSPCILGPSTYVGSGHFLGVQNLEFQYFGGFSKNEYLGAEDFGGSSQNWTGFLCILGSFLEVNIHHIQESQEVSPFQANDYKAAMKRLDRMTDTKHK